jgi:hypothetical protein
MMPKGMAPITSGRVSRAPLKNSVRFDFISMATFSFTCHHIQENHPAAVGEFATEEPVARGVDFYQRSCRNHIPTNTLL